MSQRRWQQDRARREQAAVTGVGGAEDDARVPAQEIAWRTPSSEK